MSHPLHGNCHCGNLQVHVGLSREPLDYQPRACDCGFCQAHGAAYISDAGGSLAIEWREEPGRYRHGSRNAEFLFCRQCGVLVAVTYEADGRTFAALNVRALGSDTGFAAEAPASPQQLPPEQRIERWKKLWFADVALRPATAAAPA
ncbi:GFA family protein [Pseudomonas knackmussii]|uniref:GFA family protein n=1 Tax=Pseudomonas knackmussii TaxID=65741 RepID=UPI003F49CD1A